MSERAQTGEAIDVAALAAEIGARLEALPNQTVPVVRGLRREYSRRLAGAAPDEVVALALRLRAEPSFAHRFVGYELVAHHRAALGSLDAPTLEVLGAGLDSWESVDTFGCYLAGPAWRAGQVPDTLIAGWAEAPDRWWRRAALVSTVPLNLRARGGRGDPPRTLAVCMRLVADRDDMVVKALSWALRALAERDPEAVRAFLAAQGAGLAARVRREVEHKLRTGRKHPPRGGGRSGVVRAYRSLRAG